MPHIVRELVLELEEAEDVEAGDEALRLSQQLPPEGVDEAREAVVRRIVQDDELAEGALDEGVHGEDEEGGVASLEVARRRRHSS